MNEHKLSSVDCTQSVWMSKSPSCSLSLPTITHIDCLCTYAKILPWRRWSGQMQRFRKTKDNLLSHDAAVLLITEQEHIDKNTLLVWTGPWALDSKSSVTALTFIETIQPGRVATRWYICDVTDTINSEGQMWHYLKYLFLLLDLQAFLMLKACLAFHLYPGTLEDKLLMSFSRHFGLW